MPKLQRAKTVACGLLRWDRCCIIVVSHWSKPAGQNMASLLVVVGFRTSHSMPKEESHVIFSKNLPLKGVPQAHAAHKDAGGCLVDTLERAVMLHLEAVHPGWPVPAALRSGFEDGKARQPHAALRGTIAPPMRRACNASGPGVHRGPRFLRCRCGQRRRLLRDTGALAGGERGLL